MHSTRIVSTLNHVGISVRDLERSREFWVGGLGAHAHGEFGWPVGSAGADESLALRDTAAQVVLLRTDAAFMELFRFTSPAQQERPSGAPGVRMLTWAVPEVAAAVRRAVTHGGTLWEDDGQGDGQGDAVICPDGTPVRIVPSGEGPSGLVGVEIHVAQADEFAFQVSGPVRVDLHSGAEALAPSPVDLGVNHVCLDVADADVAREQGTAVRWHHRVTESSGGIARVCYGTTHDGVLVELLESRAPEAFFSRTRLARADG